MSNNRLYGDAKATAHEWDEKSKQRALAAAKKDYEDNPATATKTALATALFDVGSFEDAEKLIQEVLSENGDNIHVLFDLGFIYKNLERKQDAREAFLRVIDLDPKHHLARGAENEIWTMDPSFTPSWQKK
ncbi:tetratricopeptide repeat protein [bacterium]|nr:tetratricopeptide repeat protein [bacterium]